MSGENVTGRRRRRRKREDEALLNQRQRRPARRDTGPPRRTVAGSGRLRLPPLERRQPPGWRVGDRLPPPRVLRKRGGGRFPRLHPVRGGCPRRVPPAVPSLHRPGARPARSRRRRTHAAVGRLCAPPFAVTVAVALLHRLLREAGRGRGRGGGRWKAAEARVASLPVQACGRDMIYTAGFGLGESPAVRSMSSLLLIYSLKKQKMIHTYPSDS